MPLKYNYSERLEMCSKLHFCSKMDFNSYKEAKVLSYTTVPYRDPGQSVSLLVNSGDFHHFSSKSAFANIAEIDSFSYFTLRNKL